MTRPFLCLNNGPSAGDTHWPVTKLAVVQRKARKRGESEATLRAARCPLVALSRRARCPFSFRLSGAKRTSWVYEHAPDVQNSRRLSSASPLEIPLDRGERLGVHPAACEAFRPIPRPIGAEFGSSGALGGLNPLTNSVFWKAVTD